MTKLLHADLTNGVVDSALKFAKIFDKSEEGFAKGGLARLPSGVRATVAVSAPPRSGRCSDVRVHELGTHRIQSVTVTLLPSPLNPHHPSYKQALISLREATSFFPSTTVSCSNVALHPTRAQIIPTLRE